MSVASCFLWHQHMTAVSSSLGHCLTFDQVETSSTHHIWVLGPADARTDRGTSVGQCNALTIIYRCKSVVSVILLYINQSLSQTVCRVLFSTLPVWRQAPVMWHPLSLCISVGPMAAEKSTGSAHSDESPSTIQVTWHTNIKYTHALADDRNGVWCYKTVQNQINQRRSANTATKC